MAPLDLINPVVESIPGASIHTIEDGDHSFRVLKRTGRDASDVLDEVVGVTAAWISTL